MIRVNLVVLRCRDVEGARAFYEGVGLVFAEHRHGQGPRHYAHEGGGVVVELYPAKAGYADETGVGFAVSDLEGARARLVAMGIAAGEIRENPWGRSFVVRDPDGRRVEIAGSES